MQPVRGSYCVYLIDKHESSTLNFVSDFPLISTVYPISKKKKVDHAKKNALKIKEIQRKKKEQEEEAKKVGGGEEVRNTALVEMTFQNCHLSLDRFVM